GPRGDLPPRPAHVPPQRAPPRTGAAAADDCRAAPPGGADLEEGDPGNQPRTEQLAGADRLAGALGRRTAAPRPTREAAAGAGHDRGTHPPPRGLPARLRPLRQAARAS